MQKMQHDPLKGQTKIVVESRDHKETVNAAKLQNSMVRLMYAMTKTIDWDNGTIKSVSLATFTQKYQNLLECSVSVKVTQLENLFRTIFPLNRMKTTMTAALSTGSCPYMSFPPKSLRGI
jgi:hypothetical protein